MATTFQATGHPDWQPSNSTPIPVLTANQGDFPPGTWGPFTVDNSSGGAYLIVVSEPTAGELTITDITVAQFDILGNRVHVDFFGGVLAGSSAIVPTSYGGPTMCRGNIYGATMQISGNVATSAYQNAVFGQSGMVAANAHIRVYIIPNSLSDPEPRVYNGAPEPADGAITLPGNVLATIVNTAIAFGASTGEIDCVPYAGPALLNLNQHGVTTTPTNVQCEIRSFSVAGGTNPLVEMIFTAQSSGSVNVWEVNLPAMLNLIEWNNLDSAQNATVTSNLIATNTD